MGNADSTAESSGYAARNNDRTESAAAARAAALHRRSICRDAAGRGAECGSAAVRAQPDQRACGSLGAAPAGDRRGGGSQHPRLGAEHRAPPYLSDRRFCAVLLCPDPDPRPADRSLCAFLYGQKRPDAALLCLSDAVHRGDDGHCHFRQHSDARGLLGADIDHVVPADRLLA